MASNTWSWLSAVVPTRANTWRSACLLPKTSSNPLLEKEGRLRSSRGGQANGPPRPRLSQGCQRLHFVDGASSPPFQGGVGLRLHASTGPAPFPHLNSVNVTEFQVKLRNGSVADRRRQSQPG